MDLFKDAMCKVNLRQVPNNVSVFYYLPLRLLPAERVAATNAAISPYLTITGKKFPREADCPLRVIFVSTVASLVTFVFQTI